MRHAFLIACLAIAASFSVGCGGGGGGMLRDPGPTLIPNALPPQSVRAAIITALPRHRWVAEAEQGNRIIAGYYKGQHAVRVAITYDAQYVYLQYAESMEMNYRVGPDGTQYIHPNYNRWVENLRRDIERAMLQSQPGLAPPVQVIVVPTSN